MKKIFYLLFLPPMFAFSSTSYQSIMDSNMDFEKAKETVKYVPKQMDKQFTQFYNSYKNGNVKAGYLLAVGLYEKKRFVDAGEILSEIISSPEVPPEAFTLLGTLFLNGEGVRKDCLKAGMFFMGGVSAGDCDAYKEMYIQYKNGICVNPNIKKANKFLSMQNKCIDNKKKGIVKAKKIKNKMVIQK